MSPFRIMINKRISTPLQNRIGYARVSSVGQNLDSQTDALQQTGCAKIFSEKMIASQMDRPAWEQVLQYVRPADTIVVTELNPLTRSLLNLLETVKTLEERGVNHLSLRENIDSTTTTGRCFLSMMGTIHQVERELRAKRAAAGRASAKRGENRAGAREPTSRSWKLPKFFMRIQKRPLLRYVRPPALGGEHSLRTWRTKERETALEKSKLDRSRRFV